MHRTKQPPLAVRDDTFRNDFRAVGGVSDAFADAVLEGVSTETARLDIASALLIVAGNLGSDIIQASNYEEERKRETKPPKSIGTGIQIIDIFEMYS